MTGCSCGGYANYLQPLTVQDIDRLRQSALSFMQPMEQSMGIASAQNYEYRLGISSTPDNTNLYTNVFGSSGRIEDAWTVVLHIPIGKYGVIIEISNKPADGELCFKAAISEDNNPDVKIHIEFCVSYSTSHLRNYIGMVENYRLVSNEIGINDVCLEECIRRHAPKCVGPCLKDPTGWSCILCAGGSIACCLVNCHC